MSDSGILNLTMILGEDVGTGVHAVTSTKGREHPSVIEILQ